MISVGLQLIDERGDYLPKDNENWLLDCYLLLKFAKKTKFTNLPIMSLEFGLRPSYGFKIDTS